VKQREPDRPFLVVVADAAHAPDLVWCATARRLAERFWPGPLTLALAAQPGRYPPEVVSSSGTVAVRAPSHGGLRRLLEAYRAPITSTSANLAGGAPARATATVMTFVEQVESRTAAAVGTSGDAGDHDLLVLDAGTLPRSEPSTIVDCSADRPRVIREGAITVATLSDAVGEIDV
jgi:L-threonylcarbamoyladenylate synthase